MITGMEPLHISEGDLAKDVRSILRQFETGAEVIIERNAQPVDFHTHLAIAGQGRPSVILLRNRGTECKPTG